MSDEDKLKPTFSIPGPGGSLGKCALCGDSFLYEILVGESVATIECSWCPNQRLPMHKKCADTLHQGMIATDLPPGPLRTMWEESQGRDAKGQGSDASKT
jgi:hypothetical protein